MRHRALHFRDGFRFITRLCMAALLGVGLTQPAPALARSTPESFADLAEALSPAVVNISTSQVVKRPQGQIMPQFPPGSPFEELFRDFFEQQPGRRRGAPQKVNSLGSGFVIDPSGFIVTNNHVIEDADEIIANFADGTSLPAKLLGRDPKTDLALLKVEPSKPLVAVSFGDSDKARVGDWVLAIGNPFGFGGTVTAGIISARNRNINAGPYDDFLQTDAAINRGNSGGPMFNMAGEVIGVNTAIISPSGGSIGIGFAVPSAIAAPVIAQLREFGETRRGWLGVRIREVTDELAEGFGLEKAQGALVEGVTENGPAAKAGIEPGDIILKFDGQDVDKVRTLPRMVAETAVGKTVRVLVWRKGKTRTVEVVLGRLEEGEKAETKPDQTVTANQAMLGMSFDVLTDRRRQSFNIPAGVEGVLITEVAPGSPAAEKGIRPGDVLLEVAQEKVKTPTEAINRITAIRNAGRKSILVLVQRGEEPRFYALRFP